MEVEWSGVEIDAENVMIVRGFARRRYGLVEELFSKLNHRNGTRVP